MDESTAHIGRRLREIRLWREQTLREVAELAGLSQSYLSMIERGLKPVERRATREALAHALRVAPSALVEGPSAEPPAVSALRTVLACYELGETVEGPAPPWEQVTARLDAMNALRPIADYNALGMVLPELIGNLHASVDGPHRRTALIGLVDCYSAAQATVKNLGVLDLAQVAARHVRDATSALSAPEWDGLAAWARAQAISSTARNRAYDVAVNGARAVSGGLDRPEVAEVYGSLHLTAALASVTRGRLNDAADHVREATEISARPGVGSCGFGHLSFGTGNVAIWRTLLEVEAGNGGRAVEIARTVDPSTLPPAPTRRAAWWIEVGRGLAMERGTRDQAVHAFSTAESLAPQRVQSNPWVREAVTGMLSRARQDAGGRELRRLALRMGIAG